MTESRTKLLAMAAAGMLLMAGLPATAVAQSSLTVATGNASSVTADSATLNGNLTDLGHSENATVWFTYWQADAPANTTRKTANQTLETVGSFNHTVSGLAANTTYEFQAHAEGTTGNTSTGAVVSFMTAEEEAADGLAIGVQQGAGRVTISVTDAENASPVPDANVTVSSADDYNGTGEDTTGDDGTVSIPGPDGNRSVTVTITARADGKTGETTVTLHGNDGKGPAETPFGMSISAFVHSLKGLGVDGPLGQVVSSFAKANNPGADNKPAHAGGPEAALDMLFDDGNETDDRGPPEDAGPPEDDEADSDDEGPPDHAGGNGEGPPDHANGGDDGNSTDDGDDDVEEESEDDDDDGEEGGPGNSGNGKAKGNGK